jgi:hypothetical protein
MCALSFGGLQRALALKFRRASIAHATRVSARAMILLAKNVICSLAIISRDKWPSGVPARIKGRTPTLISAPRHARLMQMTQNTLSQLLRNAHCADKTREACMHVCDQTAVIRWRVRKLVRREKQIFGRAEREVPRASLGGPDSHS